MRAGVYAVGLAAALVACSEQGPVTDGGPAPDFGPWPHPWKPIRPTTHDLHAVACILGHVFAVGDGGIILHRAPGGRAFEKQTPLVQANWRGVSFVATSAGGSEGLLVGDHHGIFRTPDLGQTWSIANQCMKVPLDRFYAVHMQTAKDGFAVGYRDGKQWSGVKYSQDNAWTCGPTFPGAVLYDVLRLGRGGWAVGQTGGQIYLGSNGGATWEAHKLPVTETLRGVAFAGGILGLAVGQRGTILRSTDGAGKTWARIPGPTTADLYDVTFPDSSRAWAVGDQGTVLHSGDGGLTWTRQATGMTARLEGVCFTSDTEGWAVGSGGLVLTTSTAGR